MANCAVKTIESQPTNRALAGYHLGRRYECYVLPVQIAIIDEAGQMKSKVLPVVCVRNWQQSALCLVNPFRKALVDRNLLLELSLHIELDGANRATKILAAV